MVVADGGGGIHSSSAKTIVVSAAIVNEKQMGDEELRQVSTEQGYRDIVETEGRGRCAFHYQLSRVAVGCYLSHLNVLRSVDVSPTDRGGFGSPRFLMVFEDDVQFPKSSSFLRRVSETVASCDRSDDAWDLLLLGCTPVKYETLPDGGGERGGPAIIRVLRFYGMNAMVVPVERAAWLASAMERNDRGVVSQQIDNAMSGAAEKGEIQVRAPVVDIFTQPPVDLDAPAQSNIQPPLIEEGGRDPTSTMPAS